MSEIEKLNKELDKLQSSDINLNLKTIEDIQVNIEKINPDKITPIFNLIDINIAELNIQKLNTVLGILFMNYSFDGKIEKDISLKLIKVLDFISKDFNRLKTKNADFSLYLIFDTYFHNPGLIEELNEENKNSLINKISEIAKIHYTNLESKDSDLILALQKIIDLTYYFGKEKRKYILEKYFCNHFDKFIVDCAKDELKTNCA